MRPLLLLPLLLVACETGPFPCGGKSEDTVPRAAVCDGVVDCWGGQDERVDGCTTALSFCDQPEPQAILATRVCDGSEDCPGGLDEQACDDTDA